MSFEELEKKNQSIIGAVTQEHRGAASFLPFTAAQLQQVFSEQEVEVLAQFVAAMHTATDDNKRSAALIDSINSFATPVVKLLKLAKVIA